MKLKNLICSRLQGLAHKMAVLAIAAASFWSPANVLHAEDVTEVLLCGYRIPLDASSRWELLQNDAELLVLRSAGQTADARRLSAQWLLSCQPNAERTTRVGEIRADARERGHSVHQLIERSVDQAIEAAVFSRTRVHEGRRIKSVEAYFATRELEYRIFALPLRDARGQIPARAYDRLLSDLNAMLDGGKFQGSIESTIRESQYRLRLYLASGLLVVLTIGLLWLAIRIVLRPRKRTESPADD